MKKIKINQSVVFYLAILFLFGLQYSGIFKYLMYIIDIQNMGPKDITVNQIYLVRYLPQLILLPIYCFIFGQFGFWFARTILKADQDWFKKVIISIFLFIVVDFLFFQVSIISYLMTNLAQWGGSNVQYNYWQLAKMALANFDHWDVVFKAYLLSYWPVLVILLLAIYFRLDNRLTSADKALMKANKFIYILFTVASFLSIFFLTYNFDSNSKFYTLLPNNNRAVDKVGLTETRSQVNYPVYYPTPLPTGYIQEIVVKKATKYDSILTSFVNRKYKINILYNQVNSKTSKIVQKYTTAVEYLEDKNWEYKKEQYKNYELYFYKSASNYKYFNSVIFSTTDGIIHNISIAIYDDSDLRWTLLEFIDSLSKQ